MPPVPAQASPVASAMRSSDLARIEAKLNRLLEREAAPQFSFAPESPVAARKPMQDAIAEINRRQAELDRGFQRAGPVPPNAISSRQPLSPPQCQTIPRPKPRASCVRRSPH